MRSRPFPLRRPTLIEAHPLCGCTAGCHLQTTAGERFTRHPPLPLNVSLLGRLLQISNTPHAKHIFLQPSLTSRSHLSEGYSYRPSGIPFLREKKAANPCASRGALISSGSVEVFPKCPASLVDFAFICPDVVEMGLRTARIGTRFALRSIQTPRSSGNGGNWRNTQMFKKSLAALAVLGAAAGYASAADVTLFGVVDTGPPDLC